MKRAIISFIVVACVDSVLRLYLSAEL